MRAIQAHFATEGRDPSDLELETLAQTWSEHCVHKTLKSEIIYRGPGFGTGEQVEVRFDNLLKSTIAAATNTLNRDWCLSVFEDNAGVIALDDEYGIAFKVETHNHPSAIEPYGGAATGVGGCIRDVLGCGLGAKPIASTDVFCLAPPDWPRERLPGGVLHPRRVLNGVVAGVRDYGNRMGIPTVNGALCFDERYLTNPLVFCGCVGIIPRNRIAKAPQPGDHVVLVGGRTGRDGIHGATFSSSELTGTHADEFSHAVQIGNPIEEKKVLDAILRARDHESGCLFNAITDCGAGGLSSAVGEMAADLGAEVELKEVPLKYAGLRYDEIWISEAQERMVLAVPPAHLDALLDVFRSESVETTVIGRFTSDRRLRVLYHGALVGDLDLEFLHDGLPKQTRQATWNPPRRTGPEQRIDAIPADASVRDALLTLLADLDVASKEWVIRQYDHEVQGGSVVKPLVGPGEGPSDAAVLRPRLERDTAIAVACGICPQIQSDPYVMATRAVDEALRNVVCVGGDPDRTAILDNFCWGGVETPEALGALVRACRGAHDAAVAFGLPFVSGKDSLNNQFTMSPEDAARVGLPTTVSVPNTLLISAVSVVSDVNRCITMDLKRPGNRLYYVACGQPDDLGRAAAIHRRVAAWIQAGHVVAAHDVSDGGLAGAVAEMCIAGDLGAAISFGSGVGQGDLRDVLFAEGPARYVLECRPDASLEGDDVHDIGVVTEDARLGIRHGKGSLADIGVTELREAWRRPLRMDEGG
jgi:phosphoribosylformylglycinamidine synthase